MKLSMRACLFTLLAAFAVLATPSLAASAWPASESELNCVLGNLCVAQSALDGGGPYPLCGGKPCLTQSALDGGSPIPFCGPKPCPPQLALVSRSPVNSAAGTGLEVGKLL
jgi:hypothetical protein